MAKARIFVDFWNFQLGLLEETDGEYSADWKKLPGWLIEQAEEIVGASLDYEGTRVYLSYDPRSEKDKGLRGWAANALGRFPGIDVTIKERKIKGPPVCQSCHQEIMTCPHCSERLVRTVEKGVDTAMVTDLLGLAWEKAWEVAVLVSSDADFIPAVELLSTKGFRVVNATFPPYGVELAKMSWASINLNNGISTYRRKIPKPK